MFLFDTKVGVVASKRAITAKQDYFCTTDVSLLICGPDEFLYLYATS